VSPYLGPVLLSTDHEIDDFRCGDGALDDWLRRRATRNQREGSSRTWVATTGDIHVVAYYASSTAVIARTGATKRAARNQPDPLPAMLLGRLAVDTRHQGRGLASALLKHFLLKVLEVADHTGVRLALVHAKNDTVADFYRHQGFEASPIDDLTLMLLAKDIRA
jgi:GNAT superfamily N-acetyltransferase